MHPKLTLLPMLFVSLSAMAQPAATAVEKPRPAQPALTPAPDARPKAITPELHQGTEARHERFNQISRQGEARLVFLGDSITEGWETGGKAIWDEHYATRDAANFGVSGDRTEHVLWRLDHRNFDGLKPALIVVMIGTNNTGHRKDPPADTAAGVKAILDRLRTKCPDSRILLMAIFPRGETPDDEYRKLNDQANSLIQKLADGTTVIYKDIGPKFLDDKGALRKDLMPDLLHPDAEGYAVWAEAIESDVVMLMGENKPKPGGGNEQPAKPGAK